MTPGVGLMLWRMLAVLILIFIVMAVKSRLNPFVLPAVKVMLIATLISIVMGFVKQIFQLALPVTRTAIA